MGPLFPQLVASGVDLGLREDGLHIGPTTPSSSSTSRRRDSPSGEQINPGQQISREQALHLYTRGNAWYLNREDDLGSIEPGKRADLLVLDRDYFTVSDDEMRRTLRGADGGGRTALITAGTAGS